MWNSLAASCKKYIINNKILKDELVIKILLQVVGTLLNKTTKAKWQSNDDSGSFKLLWKKVFKTVMV